MSQLIDLTGYPVKPVLKLLLQDKTTSKNIMFGTDCYEIFGPDFSEQSEMDAERLLGFGGCEIMPRVEKALEAQRMRTRAKAEVMTPGFIINKMNNYADQEWFGRENVFNTEDGGSWIVTEEKITFPKGKDWKKYIDSRRIEITCGEAPYIVSRYDVTTGEIIPVRRRIGLLDRKLRIVSENAETEEEWNKWCVRAFQSVYGYEWQGDSLLIARINLLNTYVDYVKDRWEREPELKEIRKIANIIVWNFWQMDGLKGTVPYGKAAEEEQESDQFFIEGFFDSPPVVTEKKDVPSCKIYDWRLKNSITYDSIRKAKSRKKEEKESKK